MKQLLEYMNLPNIAPKLEKDVLKAIGEKVCEDYNKDRDSMSDWADGVEGGLKVADLKAEQKSFPWEDAANYKSPMIYRSVWQFGDRAVVELLSNKNLVKASIENDQVPELVSRKNRISRHMNWQFNYEMSEWREQQEALFYELAAIGVVFKKTYFDPTEGRNVSRVIHYPNFAVNNDTGGDRFTECKDYTPNEIQEFVRSGVWVEFEADEKEREDEINESEDDKETEQHGIIQDVFIEQFTNYDLDDDGYAEPYIITVHKPTGSVVRIVALYDESSIYVKAGDGVVAKFQPVLQKRMQELAVEKQQQIMLEMQQALETGEIDDIDPEQFIEEMRDEALASIEIIKIKPIKLITKYGFIPDPQGRYLNWGLACVLTSYSGLINTTTNQLIDAGTLANVPGGVISQEFRNNKTPFKIKPGLFTQVNVPASVLANGMKYWQFKGADQTLMALNEQVKAESAEVAASINLQDVIAPNAPAATTLGILQEKLIPTTALMRRILQSMTHEFRIMAELNLRYTEPAVYQQVVNEPADYQQDYENVSQDIQLTAINSMTNQAQKMQMASVLSAEIPNIAQSGGDIRPVIQYMFDGIGADELYAKVYPDPSSMTPEQKAALQQQQAIQQQQLQQQQIANQLNQASLQEQQIKNRLKAAELRIKEMEAETKQAETVSEMQRKAAELQIKLSEQQIDRATAEADIERMLAQAEKYRAEAGSTVITTQVDAITKQLEFTRKNLERFNP